MLMPGVVSSVVDAELVADCSEPVLSSYVVGAAGLDGAVVSTSSSIVTGSLSEPAVLTETTCVPSSSGSKMPSIGSCVSVSSSHSPSSLDSTSKVASPIVTSTFVFARAVPLTTGDTSLFTDAVTVSRSESVPPAVSLEPPPPPNAAAPPNPAAAAPPKPPRPEIAVSAPTKWSACSTPKTSKKFTRRIVSPFASFTMKSLPTREVPITSL